MSTHSYTCTFSTPHQSEKFEALSLVTIPAIDGKVGLLARHAPMAIKLKSGIVSLHKQQKAWRNYFVWGGLASVGRQGCDILTETFTLLDELDPMVLEQDLKRYHNDLAGVTIEEDRRTISYKISIAEAMIQAIKEHKR
ncbi:F0F1 ATP synthase subunit epsilon [Alphaproteobacteria bacterium]|jgi:F0F1-type ATP synthase epsilon subunit|nr:F0F1 ATP synthase subunit epsilon [Alphaproteobacteria bacterium]